MEKLQSTFVVGVEYDADTKVMRLEFANGSVFDYEEVPAEVYAELKAAPSPGKYYHSNIKGKLQSKKGD